MKLSVTTNRSQKGCPLGLGGLRHYHGAVAGTGRIRLEAIQIYLYRMYGVPMSGEYPVSAQPNVDGCWSQAKLSSSFLQRKLVYFSSRCSSIVFRRNPASNRFVCIIVRATSI